MTLQNKKDFLINMLFAATVIGTAVVVFKFMFAYLLPFVIGVAVALAMQKPAAHISGKTGVKKQICAVILTVIISILFFALAGVLLWLLGNRLMRFITSVPGYFSGIEDYINSLKGSFSDNMNSLSSSQKDAVYSVLSKAIDSFVSAITGFISSFAASLIKNLPAFLISSVVTVVASCYIAKDFDRLKKFVTGIIPEQAATRITDVKRILSENTVKFIKGYSILAAITFAELTIAFFIIGINNPVLKALIISFVDVLPVLGVGTVLIPWSVVAFLGQNYFLGGGLILTYVTVAVVRNFAEPKVIGGQIGINPVFTLVSMFLGLKIAGVVGMILFPLSLTVAVEYYRKTS